jgi:hypothetical protein
LSDTLTARFGPDQIFRDIDSLAPGADFPDAIAAAVGQCRVLLALIGSNWLSAEREGKRRLDDPNDYVRLEIVAALRRGTIVVPVLIEDAQMPQRNELPPELTELADRNALRLRDEGWADGVNRLTQFLERVLRASGERPPTPPPPGPPPGAVHAPPPGSVSAPPSAATPFAAGTPPVAARKERRKGILIGVLAAVAALVVIGLLIPDEDPSPEPDLDTTTSVPVRLAGEIPDVQLSQGRPCCIYAVQVRLMGFKDQDATLTTTVIDVESGTPGRPSATTITPESDDDRATAEIPVTIDRAGNFLIRFILSDPDGVELARRDVSQPVGP